MLQTGAQSAFAQMLNDGILTDIVVNAIGGSIRAHRAVLAAHSAVFRCMFSHDLREKEQSAVDISDMSSDGCQALISYLYGTLSEEEFLAHRSELLFAGDKYGIAGLKETCEKSLIDDVDTDNVLERLQMAHLYGLSALKRTCMTMLVEFKRVHRIPEDFREFARTGDGDLVAEVMESCRRQGYLPPWYDLESAGRVKNQLSSEKRR
ncbi:BTB/POZ domain-containing protein At1g55760 [Setaria viridis]|uniref:BTB domain-containing protein n=1 Tax=Setaria viridis TaxID=4556 RepID=A0A4U6VUZ3_SETVI|nr:BTB/POZ domain-containing protein At1g55760-like [Setaria viridis]TKW33708.1 hypothetical protein SEVIR_2G257500v2 [Setaria viridis]